MQFIKLTEVIIDKNRIRREFDENKLANLAESIRKKGLLHAPVLNTDGKTLVAGERRLRAIEILYDIEVSITYNGTPVPKGCIPYVSIRELNEHDLLEAELEENIMRDDLTYQERALAIAALHNLRKQTNYTHTVKATVEEVYDIYTATKAEEVADSLVIAEHLGDEDVKKAKTKKEALKIIKNKAENRLITELAEKYETDKSPHIFECADFREFKVETSSIDVILTDPPYGVDADDFGEQAATKHEYEDSLEYFIDIITTFAKESARVTKPQAHAYVFCDLRNWKYLQEAMANYGWDVWHAPLIWAKGNGMLPRPDHAPKRTYESILYAIKGDKRVRAVFNDLISVPQLPKIKFGAEKPAALYENLLRRSVQPGDTVWDPFAGAGPIFPASNKCSVRVVATERSKIKYDYAKLRLNDTNTEIPLNLDDL